MARRRVRLAPATHLAASALLIVAEALGQTAGQSARRAAPANEAGQSARRAAPANGAGPSSDRPAAAPNDAPASSAADARTYFNVGAKAYAAGKYLAAVRAFNEAYQRSARPGLLFSIAQAYRRQYYLDKNPEHLKLAVAHYRDYLTKDPQGARRADTAEALAEIEPIILRLSGEETAAPAPVVPAKPATQLMVSSPVDNVQIEVDGRNMGKLPFIGDVAPGTHRIVLTAEGYEDHARTVRVLEGSVVPLDVALIEKTATLVVRAPGGADVALNGKPQGITPLGVLQIPAGRHYVTVAKNGHRAFSRELSLEAGEKYQVQADLEISGQRVAAYALFGTAAAGMLTAGGLWAVAWSREADAEEILERRRESNIAVDDVDAYRSAVDDRDAFRTAGVVSAGAGVAAGLVGLVLFLFDEPRVAAPPVREHAPSRKAPAPGTSAPTMEVSLWLPGPKRGAWVALQGRL